jgi:Leucine-rich repeat (LRR) protein
MKKFSYLILAAFILLLTACSGEEISDPNKPDKPDNPDTPENPITSSSTVGKDGGKLHDGNIHVSIPAGSFTSDTKVELKKQTGENVFGTNKASDYYTVTGLPADFSKPITITVIPDKDAGADLFMAMGEESFVPSLNKTEVNYSFVESTLKEGQYLFELQPAEADNDAKGKKMDLTFGLVKDFARKGGGTKSTRATSKFLVYYDKKQVQDHDAGKLEKYLNDAYDELVNMGFSFSKRTNWPVQVNLYNRQSYNQNRLGEFVPSKLGNNRGYMTFNAGYMSDETLMKSTAGHELFHLVQALYDPRWAFTKAISAGKYYWLDEATATWFEEIMAGEAYSSVTRQGHHMEPLKGIYKGANDNPQHYGYGMAAFVKSMVGQTGKTTLSKIYQKISEGAENPVTAINGGASKSVSEMYPVFLDEYFDGRVYSDFEQSSLLTAEGVQTWNIASKEDTLKTFDNDYPGISAKIFKLNLSYDGFNDNDTLKIKTDEISFAPKYVYKMQSGGVFKLLDTGKSELSITGLKQLQKDKAVILVVVVYSGYTDNNFKTTFTVKPPTEQFVTLTTAKPVGGTIKLAINYNMPFTPGPWIDLNNNGKKDAGEEVTDGSEKSYILGAQTIRVYGAYTLNCKDKDNQLTAIDASQCTSLKRLHCYENQLTSLNVNGCTALEILVCHTNQLTSLDVSGCTALKELVCRINKLTSLNVNGCNALQVIWCQENLLTSLNVSGCTSLQQLWCENNQLTSLNVSGCTSLQQLWCENNQLTSLNVNGCNALKQLYCRQNQLTTLYANQCAALERLTCYNNQLTSLNVSGLTALQYISCNHNQLASLNASGCTTLQKLYCNNNQLTSLNISGCTSLEELNCKYNNICEVRPAIFDNINHLNYDIRYEYQWDSKTKKFVVSTDHGKGYWYAHEPEGGCHSPNPCN